MLLERSTIWFLPGISFPNHEITRNEVCETCILSPVSFIHSTLIRTHFALLPGVPSDTYWPRPLLSAGAQSPESAHDWGQENKTSWKSPRPWLVFCSPMSSSEPSDTGRRKATSSNKSGEQWKPLHPSVEKARRKHGAVRSPPGLGSSRGSLVCSRPAKASSVANSPLSQPRSFLCRGFLSQCS